MYLVVLCFYPVVLLLVANVAQGELLQVNAAEEHTENNSWDTVNSKDQHQNIQNGNSKPHIVLIVADDLGWHDVSWHNPKVHTPNLGHLATTGVILNQSYVMHICSPSRSALMTGRYPFTIGRQHGVIRPMEPVGLTMNYTLLPQELKLLGYATHAVGKWHLGFCNWKYTPTRRGFDTFYGYYNGAEDYYTHRRRQIHQESNVGDYCIDSLNTHRATDTTTSGSNIVEDQAQEDINTHTETTGPEGCTGSHAGFDFRNNTTPHFDVEGTYSTYVFASHVEKLLKSRNASEPMFLYMPFQSVHGPLQVPDKYVEPFNYVKDHNRRTFMGMLSALDEAVGRIVEALKETGHYNNTVIVFTTDNGGQTMAGGNNWPLRGRKSTLWEGGTRGSAFVHSPLLNNTAGTVSNQLVHISDWFATLVGVAGGNVTEDLDSVDQWEALAGNADPPRNIMVYNLDDAEGLKGGIRIGDYKLLLGEQGFDEWVSPPEGLPKKEIEENNITAEDITEMEINIKVYNTTIHSLNNLTTKADMTTEKIAKESIKINNININNIRKSNINRRLRNKEKLKQKIRREKLVFQSKLSIKYDDNTIFNANPLSITNELEQSKGRKKSTGQHLTVKRGKQRPFMVEAIPVLQINNTDNVIISENSWDRPPPKTFADLLNWNVEDLVNYKKLQIRVFNIKEDPSEHHDLADNDPSIVKDLLGHLLLELPRIVQPEVKPEDNRANPKYWDNIWSPGWC